MYNSLSITAPVSWIFCPAGIHDFTPGEFRGHCLVCLLLQLLPSRPTHNSNNNRGRKDRPVCGIRVGVVTRKWTVGRGADTVVNDDCVCAPSWEPTSNFAGSLAWLVVGSGVVAFQFLPTAMERMKFAACFVTRAKKVAFTMGRNLQHVHASVRSEQPHANKSNGENTAQ